MELRWNIVLGWEWFTKMTAQEKYGIVEVLRHPWFTITPTLTKPSLWASCQIHKIAGAHAPGMPGTFSPPPQVSDPDMHHGTCVTHMPWCMPGSLTSSFLWNRRRGKTFPAFPAHAQPAILRIWQEAHWLWGSYPYSYGCMDCDVMHRYITCHLPIWGWRY